MVPGSNPTPRNQIKPHLGQCLRCVFALISVARSNGDRSIIAALKADALEVDLQHMIYSKFIVRMSKHEQILQTTLNHQPEIDACVT